MADNSLQSGSDPYLQYEDIGRQIHERNKNGVNSFNQSFPFLIQRYRPDLVQNRSFSDLSALRSDPNLASEMAAKYARTNAELLTHSQIPVNTGTLSLAHVFGPGALSQMWTAPDRQIGDMAPSLGVGSIFDANPSMAGYSLNDYIRAQNKPVLIQNGLQAP